MPTQSSPPINNPAGPRNIARPATAQEHDHIRNLVHLCDAAHRHRGFHERLEGRIGRHGLGDHGRVDPGRAEAVGADLMRGVVEGWRDLISTDSIFGLSVYVEDVMSGLKYTENIV